MLCEALFGERFHISEHRVPCTKDHPGAVGRPSGASRDLIELFCNFFDKMKFLNFSSFFMKVQHEIFFDKGEANFLTTLSETS